MRRILTLEEIAEDKARDAHMKECMDKVNQAQSGQQLVQILQTIKPLAGNVISTTTTRKLPKGYLTLFDGLIRVLVQLDWSVEEIREVIQRISGRRITHELVRKYVSKNDFRNRHEDVVKAIKLNNKTVSGQVYRKKDHDEETEAFTQQVLEPEGAPSISPFRGIWNDYPELKFSQKLAIELLPLGQCILSYGNQKLLYHTKTILQRLVAETQEKLSQDSDGQKLLKVFEKVEGKYSVEMTNALIYWLYLASRVEIKGAKKGGSKAMDEYFGRIQKVPLAVMKWTLWNELES